jgi:hypothetical protein
MEKGCNEYILFFLHPSGGERVKSLETEVVSRARGLGTLDAVYKSHFSTKVIRVLVSFPGFFKSKGLFV